MILNIDDWESLSLCLKCLSSLMLLLQNVPTLSVSQQRAAVKNKTVPLARLYQLRGFLLTRYVQGGLHGKMSILLKAVTLH